MEYTMVDVLFVLPVSVCVTALFVCLSLSPRRFFKSKLSLSHFPQIWSIVLLRVGAIKTKQNMF